MTYPQRSGAPAALRQTTNGRPALWTARRSTAAPQPTLPIRRFEALTLLPDGSIGEIIQRAPAHALFESAFAALARGTIMATDRGPVAVEDLLPGMLIETRDEGFQPLLWIGTTALGFGSPASRIAAGLFRIPLDSFGPARPMPDLMLAPHARLLHRAPGLANLIAGEEALTPVPAFEDGHNVVRVNPASPVDVYHLAFADHHILRANGLEIESFHPGEDLTSRADAATLHQFLTFFPHIRMPVDFGPLRAPRLSVEDYTGLSAA